MARYLLWLALGTVRTMGNWMLFCLKRWDLGLRMSSFFWSTAVLMIEMVSREALWLPAISMCSWLTAPFSDTSRYYLYMLWMPVRDWYLSTIPKVLT